MPALPWTTFSPPDPGREYQAMASRLPLARYLDVPSFLSATMAIRTQLAHADGLIGYALDAHLAQKTFYTVSAWDSQDALDAFARANPHHVRIEAIRPRMRPTTFTFWTVAGADLPISWAEARRRIAEAEKSGPGQPEPGNGPGQPEPGNGPGQPEPGNGPGQPEPGSGPGQREPGSGPDSTPHG